MATNKSVLFLEVSFKKGYARKIENKNGEMKNGMRCIFMCRRFSYFVEKNSVFDINFDELVVNIQELSWFDQKCRTHKFCLIETSHASHALCN